MSVYNTNDIVYFFQVAYDENINGWNAIYEKRESEAYNSLFLGPEISIQMVSEFPIDTKMLVYGSNKANNRNIVLGKIWGGVDNRIDPTPVEFNLRLYTESMEDLEERLCNSFCNGSNERIIRQLEYGFKSEMLASPKIKFCNLRNNDIVIAGFKFKRNDILKDFPYVESQTKIMEKMVINKRSHLNHYIV